MAASAKPLPFCESCGRPLVPVKQLVFEALAQGATVSGAARKAKCSRQYVQTLKRSTAAGQLSLPLAAVGR
jgi:RNase P subunit RPR2